MAAPIEPAVTIHRPTSAGGVRFAEGQTGSIIDAPIKAASTTKPIEKALMPRF